MYIYLLKRIKPKRYFNSSSKVENYTKFLFLLLFVGSAFSVIAQSPSFLQDQFFDQKIGESWQRPVGITFDEEGRGFVWEKRGTVYTINENGVKSEQALIDISDEVGNWGDHGLLGFALHPDFQLNGYFYLLYVVDRHHVEAFGTSDYDPQKNVYNQATIGRITRYQADVLTGYTTIKEDSRKILMGKGFEDGFPILLLSHGIGTIAFGNDGSLLASCGDVGSFESIDLGNAEETYYAQSIADGTIRPEESVGALKSQLVNSLNGKVVRIDPETGMGLPSNPFYNSEQPNSPQSKVWALGFRNPFRFIVVPNTGGHFPEEGNPGTLLIGDVGGSAWEELNMAERGGINFGWPLYEGTEPHWGYIFAWTPNPDAPNPIGSRERCGEFLNFQDLIIEATARDTAVRNNCDTSLTLPPSVPTFIHHRPTITWSGKLWNHPKRAKVTSFDEDGSPIEYQFDEPDKPIEASNFAGFTSIPGFFYNGATLPEEYQGVFFQADLSGWIRNFHFNEEMQVTKIDTFALWDDKGVVHIAQNPSDGCIYWCHIYENEVHKICYGGNPPPIAAASADRYFGSSPLEVQFKGDQSYDPDGSNISYLWDFGDGSTSTEPNPVHTFITDDNQPESYDIQLTVIDTGGLSNTQKIMISLNNTPPAVSIDNIEDGGYYSISGPTYLPLTATVTDQEHSQEELNYNWEVFFHHNDHYHPEAPVNTVTAQTIIDPVGCEVETYWYRIKLTVTDANGLSTFDEKEIFPYCGDPIIELEPLQGQVVNQSIVLNWNTLFEDRIETFEIERTLDIEFAKIGEVSAISNYQFTDDNPDQGINYYRIKALNADGIYDFSNIIAIAYPPKLNYYVAPNPVEDLFKVHIAATRSSQVEFDLYNSLGQLVLRYDWNANPGEEFNQDISVANLSNGIYVYHLKDGELEESKELVVLR